MKYNRAVTFSFDDGNVSDFRLVELFNKYGVKCSFNLNSGLYSVPSAWDYNGFHVEKPKELKKEYYEGHEVCVHGLMHASVNDLTREQMVTEFAEDKKNLEAIFGQKMEGAAWAYGIYNDTACEVLKELGIKHCRTCETTWDFGPQENMLLFKSAGHFRDADIFEKIDKFFSDDSEDPKVLYIWGHSYECDGDNLWDRLEEVLRRVSGKENVLYAGNTECFRELGFIE